jgi:type IV secretory pathway VirD2 relaxase
MKVKKTPLEPSLHERAEFRPRLVNSIKNGDRRALSTIKYALRSLTTRSYSKAGSKGAGRIRPSEKAKQRVFIKVRVVKTPKASTKLYVHLLYLARSGVCREGESPHFFDSDKIHSRDELNQTITQWGEDKHHFRFIISPENGRDLDLEEYTRLLLEQMQKDLGEQLTWFATCHYNTDEPHVHVVVRGVGKDGKPLHIAKDYVRHGMRELAQSLATEKLGQRTQLALEKSLSQQSQQKRWTSLDASLESDMEQAIDGSIRLYKTLTSEHETTKTFAKAKLQRLLFLKTYELAEEISPGVWKLRSDAKPTLKQLEKLQNAQELVTKHVLGREAFSPLVIHDPTVALTEHISGEVLGTGLYDGSYSKQYLLISGFDGRNHLVEPSRFALREGDSLRRGQLITVTNQRKHHAADTVIMRFAEARGNVFSEKLFEDSLREKVSKGTWQIPFGVSLNDYLERYRTRLSSLEDTGIITPIAERTYQVPKDLHQLVAKLDESLGTKAHMKIQIDSYVSMQQQIVRLGGTWLDSFDKGRLKPSDVLSPLGAKLIHSLEERRAFLHGRGVPLSERSTASLNNLEVARITARLEKLYGKQITPQLGSHMRGFVKRYKILGSGLHQVITTKEGHILRKLPHTDKRIATGTLVQVRTTPQGVLVEQVLGRDQSQSKGQKR